MKKTFKLDNPILINGKKIAELSYDANEITAQMFAEADYRKLAASGSAGNKAGAVELDYGMQLYLGFEAIIAVNPEIALADLERIHGVDLMKIMRIGRDFTFGRSEEASNPDSSDEPSETTPEPSTRPSAT